MRYIILYFLIFTNLHAYKYTNELINETSPYLLQHAHNPVHWMAYGKKAFDRAKREHKPIFLSIGYSTCHWCHVMEEESFGDEKTAELFNRYFVCIKVDREEYPQIDSYYQQLYYRVKGRSGGWPLNVMLDEEKKPFYISTYIPPKQAYKAEGLDTLLARYGKKYREDKSGIESESKAMLSKVNRETLSVKNSKNVSVQSLIASLNRGFDDIYFGFSIAPKFPEASKLQLMFLLARYDNTLYESALSMLDMMALRGLYDQIDGGFYRYSTDAGWEIPHFEKMLYNQAELVPLYAYAYKKTGKQLYKEIVEETVSFAERRFEKEGLFYSASDADSDKEEGGYFTFTKQEIEEALADNPYKNEINKALDIPKYGNFDGKVHLNFFSDKRPKGFFEFRDKLQNVRAKRKYPFVDKKINTAWNAMMVEAYYKAKKVDKKYIQAGDKHLEKLLHVSYIDKKLHHQKIGNKRTVIDGYLEDYSFLISALIESYEATYDEKKLRLATKLTEKAIDQFYNGGIWYLSSDALQVKADMQDRYYTSALGRMLQNLLKLAVLDSSLRYKEIADNSLSHVSKELQIKQSDAPSAAIAYLMNKIGVIGIKNSKTMLLKNQKQIEDIDYPFIVTKAEDSDRFLACSFDRCFSYSKNLLHVREAIEKRGKSGIIP